LLFFAAVKYGGIYAGFLSVEKKNAKKKKKGLAAN